MTTIKENAENSDSNYKLIFAMFFLVVIVIVVLAVALRLSEYGSHALSTLSVLQDGTGML